MKKKTTKWALICVSGLVLLLVLTNPSNKQYEEFLKSNGYKLKTYYPDYGGGPGPQYEYGNAPYFEPIWGKRFNYLIFSSFSYKVRYEGKFIGVEGHIGILSNFFETRTPIIK